MPACVYVCSTCVQVPVEAQTRSDLLELELMAIVSRLVECWELDSGPLQKRQLPGPTELSPQPYFARL